MHTTIAEMRRGDLGQHFAAIADYDIAIRLNPDDADAYYNRGNAKSKTSVNTSPPSQILISPSASMRRCAYLGQAHFAAIADYDIAIRLNPDDADAYNNRGNAKMRPRSTLCRHRRL